MRQFYIFITLSVILNISEASREDWSQWRGSNRDGVASTEVVPKKWPRDLTKAWKLEVGEGHSSPVVMSGRVYTFTREGEEEVARSIELATGKTIWRSAYAAPYTVYPGAAGHGTGPRSTPVLWKKQLFTFGISGILSSFDAETGGRKWQKVFEGLFAEAAPPFGASMSPMIADGILIAHVGGHEGGALMALDPITGNEKWVLKGEGPSYASPILFASQGSKQIVLQAHRKIMAVDLHSGKLLWSIPFITPCNQNIVTPLQAGDTLIFSSLDTGTFALRINKKDEFWIPERIWSTAEVSMYMSSPVYVDGRIIGMSHKKQGQFYALDSRTGALLWTSEGRVAENAAFVVAKENVLVLKDDGVMYVLPTNSKAFAPIRTYEVSNTATWAHPVPVTSGLLVKDLITLTLWTYSS